MFKLILSSALFFSCFGNEAIAQSIVTFDDESTLILDGRLIAERKKFSYENPEEVEIIERTFVKFEEDTIEISIYGEFMDGSMDDLYVYRIHNNQIDLEGFEVTYETDFEGRFLFYTINFSALDTEFQYVKYSFGNSVPEPVSFSFFNVNSDEEDGLEALVHLIRIN